jgi:hypothetical protein
VQDMKTKLTILPWIFHYFLLSASIDLNKLRVFIH